MTKRFPWTRIDPALPASEYDAATMAKIKSRCRMLENGCWEYLGTRNEQGYGFINYRGRPWAVHRLTLTIVKKGRIHRNRMVMILSMVFYKAIGRWCISDDLTNPCQSVERWPTRPRDRYVTDEEFNGCRALCCSQVQIAMDLALLTGQRQSDIVGMTWKQVKTIGVPRVDWRIEITQGKTGKKLAIMISPAIETVLKRARMMDPMWPREFVIRTKWGKRYSPDGFRALWQRSIRAWVKSGGTNFHFHDIRAKCISDNKDLDAAYLLAGHMDVKMTRRVYDRAMRRVEPLR